MANLNRKCIICGKRYEYCGHCNDKVLASETWRNIYCSEKCRGTFGVFEQYTAKKITADVAAQQLNNLGVDLNRVSENFKKTITSIEAHKTKPKFIITEIPVVEEKQEEVKVSAPRKRRKRKRNNIVNED